MKSMCLLSHCLSHKGRKREMPLLVSAITEQDRTDGSVLQAYRTRPLPTGEGCWAVYAKVHHLLPVSKRKEASAGTANMTQLQTDR